MISKTPLLLIATWLAACLSTQAASIVVNGSFESETTSTAGDPITGWTIVGGTILVVTAANDDTFSGPSDGNNLPQYGGPNGTAGGSINQDLSTIIGQQYKVTFDYGFSRKDSTFVNAMEVTLGTATPTVFNASATTSNVFSSFEYYFTATDTTTNIRFREQLSTQASTDAYLDNISVVASSIPEPSRAVLLGFGIFGVLLRRRRPSRG